MGMIERFKRLVRTSIADLTAASADPELALSDIARDIDLGRGELAAAIEENEARRRHLSDRLAEIRRSEAEWTDQASRALAAGEDPTARAALRQRRHVRTEAAALEARVAEAEQALAALRKNRAELERKLMAVRLEQTRISARLRQDESETLAAEVAGREERPKRRRGRREAPESFSEFEEELIVEAELEALKRRLKPSD
jgi:phage shock protein A